MPSEQRDISDGTLVVQTAMDGNTWRITLRGELDLSNAPIAETALRDALSATETQVVVDMGDLEFIDSTGIALLVSTLGRNGDGARLRFVPSRSAAVTRVLELTGVAERLPLAQ